jgi:hypothetical protein
MPLPRLLGGQVLISPLLGMWDLTDSLLPRTPVYQAQSCFAWGSTFTTPVSPHLCLEVRMLPMLGGDLYEIAFRIDYRGFVVPVPSEPWPAHDINSRCLHRLHETINGIARPHREGEMRKPRTFAR